jgi:2',3'-cyclic-nucleotide 2'-phosphodiesterase (5'-nucleotidase family)
MQRRKFIQHACLPFVALFLLCGLAGAQQNIRSITILHSNDLHAQLTPNANGEGGLAYLATAIRRERDHCEACLYLNAGDLVQGSPVSTIYHGVPLYELGNMLGIQVSTLGNHEFDYGAAQIQEFLKTAQFPIVSANVVDKNGQTITGKAYTIVTVGELRVAVIGAMLGDLAGNNITVKQLGPWHVIPVVDAVKHAVQEIGSKADLFVVLGHIHHSENEEILRQVPEVSVVVSGHDHGGYKEMVSLNGGRAVEVRGFGAELGRLDLKIEMPGRKIVSADWKHIPVNKETMTPAPDVAERIDYWEQKVSKVVDVPIGEAKRTLSRDELRPLFEAAMAEEAGADFGFISKGNIRTSLPAGTILARQIWNILPFDNMVMVGKFKGSDLPAKVKAAHEIDPDRIYSLAVTDFTMENQASPDQFGASGFSFPKATGAQRDLVIEWVKKKRIIE